MTDAGKRHLEDLPGKRNEVLLVSHTSNKATFFASVLTSLKCHLSLSQDQDAGKLDYAHLQKKCCCTYVSTFIHMCILV